MLDENNGQLGIMSLNDAKTYAYDRGYDLVMIAPSATPPVCRAMDYGKYRYEADKKEKETRKKQQVIEVKEVQLSYKIEQHDFETKVNRAIKFLQETKLGSASNSEVERSRIRSSEERSWTTLKLRFRSTALLKKDLFSTVSSCLCLSFP